MVQAICLRESGLGHSAAEAVAGWYAQAQPEERRDMWLLMCEQFAADAERVKAGVEPAGVEYVFVDTAQ